MPDGNAYNHQPTRDHKLWFMRQCKWLGAHTQQERARKDYGFQTKKRSSQNPDGAITLSRANPATPKYDLDRALKKQKFQSARSQSYS